MAGCEGERRPRGILGLVVRAARGRGWVGCTWVTVETSPRMPRAARSLPAPRTRAFSPADRASPGSPSGPPGAPLVPRAGAVPRTSSRVGGRGGPSPARRFRAGALASRGARPACLRRWPRPQGKCSVLHRLAQRFAGAEARRGPGTDSDAGCRVAPASVTPGVRAGGAGDSRARPREDRLDGVRVCFLGRADRPALGLFGRRWSRSEWRRRRRRRRPGGWRVDPCPFGKPA